MSDAINKLAAQFAEANRQDKKRLANELRGLRQLLSAIVLQQGGEYAVGDRARMAARPDDEMEYMLDTKNRSLRIRRVDSPLLPPGSGDGASEVAGGSSIPDWML